MLVETALGGGGDYTAEMPSMKECLDARITIAEQDPNVKTLCVPISNDSAKVQELIDSFMKMIEKIKDKETSREKFICDKIALTTRYHRPMLRLSMTMSTTSQIRTDNCTKNSTSTCSEHSSTTLANRIT